MRPVIEPSRPLARKRLDRALEEILVTGSDEPRDLAFSDLRRKLALISQEKRFILVMYLMRETAPATDYDIATAIRDRRSNVVRNLYALVAEHIVVPSREDTTGIVHYKINRRTMNALSELLHHNIRGPGVRSGQSGRKFDREPGSRS